MLESVPLAVLVMVHLGEPIPAKSEPETSDLQHGKGAKFIF